jgi:Methyltransferase domain
VYHQVPSDVYFGEIANVHDKFDVIYLDGLHTAEQTLRDLMNSLCLVKSKGVIVVDDVYPDSYAASLPDVGLSNLLKRHSGQTDHSWMGDVFKLVFFVHSFCQQHSFATVSDNHGQLVMWPEPRPAQSVGGKSLKHISHTDFVDKISSIEVLNRRLFADIVMQVSRAIAKRE